MYRHIMMPIDLGHMDQMGKALQTTADLAKHYNAPVTYVGVTAPQPTATSPDSKEYAVKLATFAAEQENTHGITAVAHVVVDRDPALDLNRLLLDLIGELRADLVVMASHSVGRFEWSSHGGTVAAHADVTVMLVRGEADGAPA